MLFNTIQNEADVQRLKRDIDNTPDLRKRVLALRRAMNFRPRKEGVSKTTEETFANNAELLALYKEMVASG